MPVNPGTTTPIFFSALVANGLIGPSVSQLATGMAAGLYTYLESGITVTSIDLGVLGVGTGFCPTILLDEQILLAALTTSLPAHGVTGPFMPSLANGVALGVSASLALAIVNTINPVVGIGAGKLQLIPNGSGSVIFPAAFLAAGATGPMSALTASAIGLAIDSVIATAIGVVAIIGSPSIIPMVGAGTGTIQ